MAAEDFFSRWSKKKTDASAEDATLESAENSRLASATSDVRQQEGNHSEAAVKSLPTQEDVDKLTHDSDYSAFMSHGVDESVKRSAMKKLFTDPHFNIMDGLDIYIDDYNKFEPITPALLASLNHAKALLDPLSQLQEPFMRLLEKVPQTKDAGVDREALAIDGQAMTKDDEHTASTDDTGTEDITKPPVSEEPETSSESEREKEFSEKNAKAQPDVSDSKDV